ncbi:MAG: ABC transporter permease [Clostridiales bacterium]|nr:ABC transporter permease [Clostridiales bacterium]
MIQYLIKKLPQTILVIIGVSIITFIIMHLSGNPAQLLLPPEATEQQIEEFSEALGYNDPLPEQYFRFMKGVIKGDFGTSMVYRRPAFDIVLERFPATIQLAICSMIFAIIVAVPMGILAAVKRNTIFDYISMTLALGMQSMPTFWLGIMLVMIFSVKLGWLPTSGRGTFQQLILPTITLGAFYLAMISRLMRSGLLGVLSEDYISTARAKGVKETLIVLKHALKNSIIPLVTVVGMEFGRLLGGAVVTEAVFEWPGVGQLALTAIGQRDYPVVQGVIFVLALTFVLVNLLTDLSYSYLDPRIRFDSRD